MLCGSYWWCYSLSPHPGPSAWPRHAQWVDVRQVPRPYLPTFNAHLVGPYNILIADNGYYCAVDDWDYVSAGDGDLFT